MSSPIGMAEYFAMEAGEYLDRLAELTSKDSAPPPEELVRFARALRGSALMANQGVVARAAAGLEGVAKAYRESRRPWDAQLRDRCSRAITELRALVRNAGNWTEDETSRADRLAMDLESLGGVASPAGPRPTPPSSAAPGSDAGVRAFVAREGALTASALDRAARALRTSPEAHEPLYAVLRRLQSLRGLAALTDLAPLPDLLESVERAVGELTRMFAPPPQVADVFEAAAQALARCARDVAQSGKAAPDAEEARRFAELLLRAFATEDDVVPIETLFRPGEPGIREPGTVPNASPLTAVELVSHGERLCEVADELARSTSPTQRDLRLYAMVAALRPLETAVGEAVPPALGAFAGAARELIAQGGVAAQQEQFAECVREAGTVLRGIANPGTQPGAGDRLEASAQRLHRLGAPVFRPVYPTPVPPVARPSAPSLEDEVVPIESLLAAEQPVRTSAVAAAPVLATPPVPVDRPGLAGSFETFARLMAERGPREPSIEELLRRPSAPALPAEDEGEIVDIADLCYRGARARERADWLRREATAILADAPDSAPVRALLDELVDLVALAAEPA